MTNHDTLLISYLPTQFVKISFTPILIEKMDKNPQVISLQFTLLIFLSIFHHSISTTLEAEAKALLDFKNQLIDPSNYLHSWIDTQSPCNFIGVSCDPNTGHVTEITLDNKSLSGVISPSISTLESLTSLVLTSNSISGDLPLGLVNCTNLKVLNVTGNWMKGTLPDLSAIEKLEILDLSGNYFSGKFPIWVVKLTRLTSLGLGLNDFEEGQIPKSLGELKNLTWLYMAYMSLIGEIPESIFELKLLQTLDFSVNNISGNFPKSFSKLKNLIKIELYGNNLTGGIPPELAELTLLQEIDISSNQMYGKLPPEIGNLKRLIVFQIFKNNFSGEFPSGFGEMRHLKYISIYKNSFSGPFPENFGRFSPLTEMDISENYFSGGFPKYLCENGNLRTLLALSNNFSGEVAENYGNCKSLERVRMNQNCLSGKIPDGLWALPKVGMIDFSENEFSGGISKNIGVSTNLNELVLFSNKFSGELPIELGELAKLERIQLNNNNFSGNIVSQIGVLKQLSSLHLEYNSFDGPIPKEIGQCVRLVDLNLAMNSLNGNIPDTILQISSLNSLNLSGNKLTGPVPNDLQKLKLSSIDLSYNQLSGTIPLFLLTMGGDQAFKGNKELCIDETNKTQVHSVLSFCKGDHFHPRFNTNKLVLFFIISASAIAILGGLLILSYLNFKHTKINLENRPKWEVKTDPKWKFESFHPLEFDVDEICNLDEGSLVGSGGTGKVYRVDSKKNMGTVAVKQLWKGEIKVSETEKEILGKIRHKNVLKLYACLTRGGSSFLVFEYMPNGDLFHAIHKKTKNGETGLDWQQRYRIALGSAKGLAYLHHDCSPSVVHRDVKSTNILLDGDYEPKIADFGVARTRLGSSDASCFAGTHGYIAPEMAYSLKVAEKSDVYSFGVVLLELVTGRKPIEEAYGEGKDIVYWVSIHLDDPKDVLKVLDPNVVSDTTQNDMINVLKITTLCTRKLPSLRPTMKDVVKMLVDAEPQGFSSSYIYIDNKGMDLV